MSDFPISRYAIKFQALAPIQFPDYAGAALRAIFGEALKQLACYTTHYHGQCECHPVERCLYRQLFAPVRRELKNQQRLIDVPPPFIIETYGLKKYLEVGEDAHFYMVLIGDLAHQQLGLIQRAWQYALALGLQAKFLLPNPQAKLISFHLCDQPKPQLYPEPKLQLNIVTHLRLQYHGTFLRPENFNISTFCWAVFRRYLTIAEVYSDSCISTEIVKNIYEKTKNVQGISQLEWVQWSRHYKQQLKSMHLDGLHGCIQLYDIPDEIYYYLYLGQWLHLGKGCVLGLGQYQIITALNINNI